MSDGFSERLWAMLVNELSAEVREAVTPLLPLAEKVRAYPDVRVLAARCADTAVRATLAHALEHQNHKDAAAAVRALAPLKDAESAKQMMMALEKVGWNEGAPNAIVRAAGGAASTFLLLDRAKPDAPETVLRALHQIAAAVGRVVGMAARVGVEGSALMADFIPLAIPRA